MASLEGILDTSYVMCAKCGVSQIAELWRKYNGCPRCVDAYLKQRRDLAAKILAGGVVNVGTALTQAQMMLQVDGIERPGTETING